MVTDKKQIENLYYSIFYKDVKITKNNRNLSLKKVDNRYKQLKVYYNKIDTDKPSSIKNFRTQLVTCCKSINILLQKNYTNTTLNKINQLKNNITKYINILVDIDISEFENEKPNIDINSFINEIRTEVSKFSLLKYYKTYYLPTYIKKDILDLMPSTPEEEYPDARNMIRRFILHIGPTNSGKTYESLERLKQCEKGIYLGPLRLLALEVYDKFNLDNIPCNMITGEEELLVDGAKCQASTIEMLNINDYFDIAVVDEVQMLSDPYRGYNWTKAIMGLKANEIHLCLAPEAEDMVVKLIERCHDKYEIHRHERKTDLVFENKTFDLSKIQKGDALIVFSKRSVLALSNELKNRKIPASMIYGNLPPETRRHQVERFVSGQTDVIISTDAIGMGLNLPIRRVIFMETEKFDGICRRLLLPSEIKQIAGRAGRMGLYDKGYVNSVSNKDYFRESLKQPNEKISNVYVGFPETVLSLPFQLNELLQAWYALESSDIFKKMNIEELVEKYNIFNRKNDISEFSKEEVYNLITCPVDSNNFKLINLWNKYCKTYRNVDKLELPIKDCKKDLADWETHYKELDLYFQFSRKTNKDIDLDQLRQEKIKTINHINDLLIKGDKSFARKCKYCGKVMPYNSIYNMCGKCYRNFRY